MNNPLEEPKMQENILKIWASAQEAIKIRIGETTFDAWFGPIKTKSEKLNSLTIETPDVFFKDWFADNYLELVNSTIKSLTSQEIIVDLSVNPNILKKEKKEKLNVFESKIKEQSPELFKLNPKYTFENFVVGPSNRFTHAACLAVAESPAKNYNPLFIYGGVGLGKTHLMQAICHFAKKRLAHTTIMYLTSEKFTNELINAIQHHSMDGFRRKYRDVDILVIDDIHFIAGKESTQEEFFHTFNSLHDAHKQIIISSDRPPKEIHNLEDRLISRFSWGLITDVQPPDLETRVAILKKKIENEKVKIPDDVLFFLAESIKNNVRELEGALIRLVAYSLLESKAIDLSLTRDILKDMLRESLKIVNIDTIQKKVAEHYNLNINDLKTKGRNKNTVLARQVAMYLTRELTTFSLPEIGKNFGGKDHTTVLHSYNKIKEGISNDNRLKETLNRITFEIKS